MEQKNKNYDIKKMIVEKDLYSIRKFVDDTPIEKVVEELEELNDLEVSLFFRFLRTEKASELFSHLTEEQQHTIIQNLTKKEIADFINELYSDEIADVLEVLPPEMAKTILLTVDKETRAKVNQILQFSDDEVGSVMSVDIISLNLNLTNKEALELIKRKREESEIGQFYYIVDDKNRLQGFTTLEELVFSQKDTPISNKMKSIISVKTKQLKSEAANIFASADYSTLPVVDDNGVLIGMLTSNDVIDIIQDEASEDIYKAAGISFEAQSTTSYLKTTIISIVKSRIFWLLILMIGSTLSQLIIQSLNQILENKLDQLKIAGATISSVLVALIPVTSATSGNAGSQSTSTLTRAASLGELKKDRMKEVIIKETTVGLVLGLILAIANFIRLLIYYMAYNGILFKETKFLILISIVSSISLLISIILSKLLGSVILTIALKTKRDPAVMSAPLITTIIDALSTLIFFGLAFAILIPIFL
ncbi:magnesium transporter [Mesomycoplasma moatsii]|uniref:magnesium transporter n=1 Tax=Mesomycoplasma moatsii TaxID=171287 RepID=UPI0003B2F6D9